MTETNTAHHDPVIAYRVPDEPEVLLCREHGYGYPELTPLASDDLPDGGICTWGDPAAGGEVCGRDVLIDPPAAEPVPAEPAHKPDAETRWNGEPCTATRVSVIVADSAAFPAYWARHLVGTRRHAVRVDYAGATFYLDDADGSGWHKVTHGGGPGHGHRDLNVEPGSVQLLALVEAAPAGLRDRIANALAAEAGWTWAADADLSQSPTWQACLRDADAVLAVLPAPDAEVEQLRATIARLHALADEFTDAADNTDRNDFGILARAYYRTAAGKIRHALTPPAAQAADRTAEQP
ncbi:hypothetical protein AB0M28_13605 [Streptomyces sp. NPDC051940]|uniref:hypothetical protein n=1 Tax=Streptomyces sp. NPDC051940 TaxID=3155675 RepID=UPI0034273C69